MDGVLQTRRVLEVIGRTIAPYVGDTVASTTGQMHCKRLGLTGDTLTSGELDRLLASVERGLTVFIGDQAAVKAVTRVRHTLLPERAS